MASTASQLSQGATERAAEVASPAMEQMVASIKQTAQNTTGAKAAAIKPAADACANGKALLDIERTSTLGSQISGASQDPPSGAARANLAIQQIGKATQEITSASETMPSPAEELSGQVDTLRAPLGFFRTCGGCS